MNYNNQGTGNSFGSTPPMGHQTYNSPQSYSGTQQNGRQYNETLEPISNFAYTANHIMTVGLVRRVPKAQNLEKADLGEKHMFFITLAPGVGEKQNRTYDFSQKVSLKFKLQEIASLSFILKQCALGNDNNVLPYRKFAQNQGMQKSCSVWIGSKPLNHQNQQTIVKTINITFEQGSNKFGISMSAADAAGFSEILYGLFQEALKLEIQVQSTMPRGNRGGGNYSEQPSIQPQSQPGYQNSTGLQYQTQPQQQPVVNSGFAQPIQTGFQTAPTVMNQNQPIPTQVYYQNQMPSNTQSPVHDPNQQITGQFEHMLSSHSNHS